MFVTRNWYAAGRAAELGRKPLGRTICGRPMAFFRDDTGAARALDAVCPHRGADLAAGIVVVGALRCPFHGFRFDGGGRCIEVPSQLDQGRSPDRIRVASYPVVERQGLLWIWPDAAVTPEEAPPRYDFFAPSAGLRRHFCEPELYPASYLNTVENALDYAHLPFVHTRSVPGVPPLAPDIAITMYENGRGYRGEKAVPAPGRAPRRRRRLLLPWAVASASTPFLTRLLSPLLGLAPIASAGFIYDLSGMVCFRSDYENGKRDYVLALITPADETHTWFFAEMIRDRALHPIGDWAAARFMKILVGEDRAALAKLTPEARGASGLRRPALVRADRTSALFRRVYGAALRREGQTIPWAVGDGDAVDAGYDEDSLAPRTSATEKLRAAARGD